MTGPLKVSVLVDLHWSVDAGGHVKCWEKLAKAAIAQAETLDLTVHFLGPDGETAELAPNVRYRFHAPAMGTDRFFFLSGVPDHTDLGRRNKGVEKAVRDAHVLHTTMTDFAFTRTAERVARQFGIPLVNSMHTDLPGCGRIFGAQIIERLFGKTLSRPLLYGGLRLDERIERTIVAKVRRHQKKCVHALVSKPEDLATAAEALGGDRVSFLRRGIDKDFFSPAKRDKDWLEETFAIPQTDFVIVFAGRVNLGKNVRVVAEAVRRLIEKGLPVRLFCAGEGEDRPLVKDMLGERAICPGILDPDTLARVYAGAELLASPSKFEVLGNVVLEALASGLPAFVAAESGMDRVIVDGETGRTLNGDIAEAWTEAIDELVRTPERRSEMAVAARAYAEREIPTWDDVLTEDLLPVWLKAANLSRQGNTGKGEP
jgi:glycosyltransferase involved in cell wall biosynthesis